ncbi:MAG: phosphatidate cytidylyltransferase, partial [Fusobacteriaceae bacterium]
RGFSEISPKKSIEGSIGGAFFTTISLYVVNHYCKIFPIEFSVASVIIMGIALSLLIQIGDLAESMFKREFGIKDSSRLLGEHGGVLDRFDSLIFVLPIVFYFFSLVIY